MINLKGIHDKLHAIIKLKELSLISEAGNFCVFAMNYTWK